MCQIAKLDSKQEYILVLKRVSCGGCFTCSICFSDIVFVGFFRIDNINKVHVQIASRVKQK
jgi:hypothetical protein